MRPLHRMAAGLALATSLHARPADTDEFERYHRHVRVDEGLQEGAGNGAGVRIGVIDTDIDVDHREFEDRVVKVIEDPDYPYLTPGNHGTQVTGIIAAARDGRGMVGIAPEARIVSTWLLDQDGGVPFSGPGGSLVSWFDRMERSNVQVINASLAPARGGSLFNGSQQDLQALANVRSSAVVAIAAGNDGEDLEDVRCSNSKRNLCRNPDNYFGHVLVVGALKNSKKLAGFSNRPGNACFHRRSNGGCEDRLKHRFLVAPGVGVKSPLPGDRYAEVDGTSAAAPIVSGGAALIMSQWPHLKAQPKEVARILLESADDLGERGVDRDFGHGRLNLKAALRPIGTTTLATGARVAGEAAALHESGFATTSVFGASLAAGLAESRAVAFDEFGRDFDVDPSAFVRADEADVGGHDLFLAFMRGPSPPPAPAAADAASWRMALAAEADPQRHLPPGGFMVAGDHGPVQFGFANDRDVGAFANALDGSLEAGDPITGFRGDGHHMSLVGPARAFGGRYELAGGKAALGIVIAERSSTPHADVLASGDDATGVELRARLEPGAGVTLSTRFGFVREDGSVLGAEGDGAFALDGGESYYLGARLAAPLGGGFSLDLDLETGWIAVAEDGESLLESGGLRTETARLSLVGRDVGLERDIVAFGITQPLRVADGQVRVRLPVGRTTGGRVLYDDDALSAEPEGRELRLSLDYGAPLPQDIGRWQVLAVERLAPGHDPERAPETLIFGKVTLVF
jgi:Subtilase family